MPPHHHHHHHHARWFRPSRAVQEQLDAIERLLPAASGSREVRYAAFEEGPPHRRAASSVLGAALMKVLDEAARVRGVEPRPYAGEGVEVDWALPPHLRHRRAGASDSSASIPTRLLSALCTDAREREDVIQALSDGPEHDVANNVVLLNMIETLYDLVSDGRAPLRDERHEGPRLTSRERRMDGDRSSERERGGFWRHRSAGFEPRRRVEYRGREQFDEAPLAAHPTPPAPVSPEPPRAVEPVPPSPSVAPQSATPSAGHDASADSTNDPKHSRSIFDWGFRFKLWKIKNGRTPRTPE